jgi:hypothetical protein
MVVLDSITRSGTRKEIENEGLRLEEKPLRDWCSQGDGGRNWVQPYSSTPRGD